MVQMTEFRIVMPMTMDEYEVAMTYTIMKMEQQNTTRNEGVEILKNAPFEDEVLGRGQYTLKLYHFQSKVPAWLKSFAPANALVIQEESWNAYTRSKTVIKCPYFEKFCITINTIHKADNGCSENVHGLSNELLATRKVEVLDIASVSRDYWSNVIGTTNVDLCKFRSQRTGRGPLVNGWKDRHDPVMTTYKLVTIDAPYWGFGCRLEQAMLAVERALFLESHRQCFALIDEWFGMNLEEVCELEQHSNLLLNKTFSKASSRSTMEEYGEGDLHDKKKVVEYQRSKHAVSNDDANRVLEEGQVIVHQITNRAQVVRI